MTSTIPTQAFESLAVSKQEKFVHPDDEGEWLLTDNPKRFVIGAKRCEREEKLFKMYKKHMASFWQPSQIDCTPDVPIFNKLLPEEQRFIKYVLAFFAASDGIVMENINLNFASRVQIPSARLFYGFQGMIEGVHSETYMDLLNAYVKDSEEREYLSNAIVNIPCIKRKAEWAQRWMNSDNSFAEILVAFAAVEGIFFSGSFCSIFWIKRRKIPMVGLTKSNEYISRDEGLHTDFACLEYTMLKKKLSDERIKQIIGEALEIEKEFVCEAISCDMIGMSAELMSQYIDYCGMRLIKSLQHVPYMEVENPFPWMELLSLQGKTNFFEEHTTEYQLANVMGGSTVFNKEVDF